MSEDKQPTQPTQDDDKSISVDDLEGVSGGFEDLLDPKAGSEDPGGSKSEAEPA